MSSEVSGFCCSELPSFNTLHERKLFSNSRTSEQSFVFTVSCVVGANIDNVYDVDIWSVVYSIM
jgi:hypothetical protein